MKINKLFQALLLGAIVGMYSCKKDEVNTMAVGDYTDTEGPLKAAADFPIGLAVGYTQFKNDANLRTIVSQEADNVTYEYEMKHGALVQNDGTLNFARADEMLTLATAGGLEVFGHTLLWHQNQNAGYVKGFAGITMPAATELIANGGFELGGATNFSNWSTFNSGNPSGTSTITVGSGPNEVRTGTRSMKVVNPVGYPGSQWRVQVASDLFNTVVGTQYSVKYWVKAAAGGGSIRLSSGGGAAQYQGDQNIGTAWQQITWNITANSVQTRILFDMGQAANTYYIDDVSVTEVVAAPSGAQVATKVDLALQNFITNTVTHYKGKVKAWDVVNELFTDDGNIRNNNNTTIPATATDVLVWSNYLGRDAGLKAFNYAKAADPNALLFINDYGLESNPRKLDSLIAYVNEIKAKGAKVDGIGTQMHINWNSSYAAIDNVFKKLAATGLLVRVSELDVKINPTAKVGFTLSPTMMAYQANMYEYVVKSYIQNVPAAQRHGITIWGVSDKDSWLATGGKLEYPLLWDVNYSKKPAYSAVLKALKGQ